MASILKVDEIQSTSGGGVKFPTRPAFSVFLNAATAQSDFTTETDAPFDTKDFDIGNNVAISNNAVFTAPVTGIYQFNFVMSFSNVTAAAHINTYLHIDGARVGNDADLSYRNIEDPEGATYHTNSSAFLIQLTASQTVKPRFTISTDTSASVRQGARFSGFLVG